MTLMLLYLALALGVSFLCSILEAVLLSITPAFVAAQEADHPALGARLALLKARVDRPLAAILGLNTIAHTVGAAGVGAQALKVFGSGSIAVVSAVLTVLILVLSEIIPKTLGARYWKRLAMPCARLTEFLVLALLPVVLLSQGLSKLLSGPAEPTISRSELRAMADVAHREGVVDAVESQFFRSLLRFRLLQAKDIMTPRSVVSACEETTTARVLAKDEECLRFSRIPIYAGSRENMTGYVLKHAHRSRPPSWCAGLSGGRAACASRRDIGRSLAIGN